MTDTDSRVRVLHEAGAPPRPARRPGLWLGGVVAGCLLATAVLTVVGRGAPVAPPATAPAPAPAAIQENSPVRTQDSAVAAAVAAVARLGSADVYAATTRKATLVQVALPEAVPALERGFAQVADNLGLDAAGRSSEGELVALSTPVATSVVAYDLDEAVVSVWSTGLLGLAGPTSRRPVQETWSTDTVTLRWTPDGWRWAGSQHVDGPVPVGSAQVPSPPEELARTAREFVGVGAGS